MVFTLNGILYLTFTGTPSKVPGVHRGIFTNNFLATSSIAGWTDSKISTLVTSPVLLTTNDTTVFPTALSRTASAGT